ncbi:MAG: hypothetical protein Fues2KO_15220 [Fuerstiella sp.]
MNSGFDSAGEELQSGGAAGGDDSDDLVPRITAALEAGRRIEAVRIYREQRGGDLTEAVEFVDRLVPQLIELDPDRYGHLNRKNRGCVVETAGLLLGSLFFAAVTAIAIFCLKTFGPK